jgi:hypothetical protein
MASAKDTPILQLFGRPCGQLADYRLHLVEEAIRSGVVSQEFHLGTLSGGNIALE